MDKDNVDASRRHISKFASIRFIMRDNNAKVVMAKGIHLAGRVFGGARSYFDSDSEGYLLDHYSE